MQMPGSPDHHATQIVTDPHRALRADVVEQADQIAGQRGDVIGVERVWA